MSFKKNFINLFSWSSLSQVVSVLSLPIITMLYSPEDFGYFAAFISITGIFQAFSSVRFEWYIPNSQNMFEAINIAVLSMLSPFVFLLLGLLYLVFFPLNMGGLSFQEQPLLIFYFASHILISSTNGAASTLFVYQGDLSYVAQSNMLNSISKAAMTLLLGWFGYHYLALIFANTFAIFFSLCYLSYHFNKKVQLKNHKVTPKSLKTYFQATASQTLVSTFVSMFNSLSHHIATLLISTFFGAYTTGLYFLGTKLISAPLGLVSKAVSLSFWSESAKQVKINPKGLREKYIRMTKILFALSLVLIVCMLICAYFLPYVVGEKWKEISLIMYAFAPVVIGTTTFSCLDHLIVLNKHYYQLFPDISRLLLVCLSVMAASHLNLATGIMVLLISTSSLLAYLMLYQMHLKAYRSWFKHQTGLTQKPQLTET